MNTMALYLIGDVQGCDSALERLLDTVSFSKSRDTLYFLGDLVNRGPDSPGVLRRLMALGDAAQCVLGNHDLHLLAVAYGVRPAHRSDTLASVLDASDRSAMLEWLKQQAMALQIQQAGHTLLMVHAGVLPQWSSATAMALAGEVEAVLRSTDLIDFLHHMYGSTPTAWSDELTGADRLRVIVNTLTRMRFCSAKGEMEFTSKEAASGAPAGFMPWFDVPGRQTAQDTIAFGHWSTLGKLNRNDVFALDTGCVWGGCLSALRLDGLGPDQRWEHHIHEVNCNATDLR
jgi:bis(5'-nucleosyl)-tetraphosphatase (symmetrical)